MNETEKKEKLSEYFQKVSDLLGHKLLGYDCTFYGDKPVMQIVYCDYKQSIIVRAELQQMLPEVELAMVRREISDSASLSEILEIMSGCDDDEGNRAVVKMANGDELSLREYTLNRLYNRDLTQRNINYDEIELREPEPSRLYQYLHE